MEDRSSSPPPFSIGDAYRLYCRSFGLLPRAHTDPAARLSSSLGTILAYLDTRTAVYIALSSLSVSLSLSVPGNGEVTAAASYYRPPVLLLRRRSSSSYDDSFTIWYPARWMRSTLAWTTGLFRSCATLPRESWPAVPRDSTRLFVGHRLLTYSLFLSSSRNSNRAGFFATC